jgi:nucleotide-binding universal stress UspA family protein
MRRALAPTSVYRKKGADVYRRIVAGYDSTDEGRDALALAAALRGPDGVVVAACVYPSTGHGRGEQLEPVLGDAAWGTLGQARDQLNADWLELRPAPGYSPAHGLHRLCEQLEADLVVVGSSHRGEGGRVLAGSVGERLLYGSPCPVALASRGFRNEAEAPRVVGVAYDGSPEAAAALNEAAALASDLEAMVRLVTVVPPLDVFSSGVLDPPQPEDEQIKAYRRQEFRRILEEAAAPLPDSLQAATVLVEGRPADAVVNEASNGMGLLVMGSRSYGPIRRVMVGSTAIDVMGRAPCPMIVVPRGAAGPAADASPHAEARI